MAQHLGALRPSHAMKARISSIALSEESISSGPRRSLFVQFENRAFAPSQPEPIRVACHSRPQRNCTSEHRRQEKRLIRSFSAGAASPEQSFSSSLSSLVDDEEAAEMSELSNFAVEGSNTGDEEESRAEVMKMVMDRLSEEDLEEAAKKFDYEEELFSRIDFAQINAFTTQPFSGNPAAVCYLPYEKNDNWLRLIAQEFNLPTTAFVIKRRGKKTNGTSIAGQMQTSEDGGADVDGELEPFTPNVRRIENEFDIRWFTTTSELELCGHATLASAHMLFSSGLVEGDTVIFHCKKGSLKARKVSGYDESENGEEEPDPKLRTQAKLELGKGVVELDFPTCPASEVGDSEEARAVLGTLGVVEAVWVGKTAIGDYLVELSSGKDVESLRPNFNKMTTFSGRGFIATARASESTKFDFISRFFGPKIGIPEDQVTGNAHCTLGPYWAAKLGENTLQAFQASPRGGELSVRVDTDADRVYLQGSAVLLMAGTLLNTFRT